jgi:hypothetical protein
MKAQTIAPRIIIYPMEASEFMDMVKTVRQHMLPQDYEQIGPATAELCAVLEYHADLKLLNYEEGSRSTPTSASGFS